MTTTIDGLELIPALAEAVSDMGYTEPTPIQTEAIPVVLAGSDLIGCAATGTGKTAAFLLPILQRLQATKPAEGCRALILSPTRELALQIDEQALALGYHVGISAAAVVGGVPMGPQEAALRDGCDIVVATPGRLLDHMRFGYVDFSGLEVVVLDEADRMLDMGFLPDIERILAALPKTRQTLLFSATMSPRIRRLARAILRNPVTVTVDQQKPASGITQSVCTVAQERKAALLCALLRADGMSSVLVFVRRKIDADWLARSVSRSGVDATSIHSDRTQPERFAALEAFRRGQYLVLVATDVAARGLDVEGISHVINFDVPHSSDDYIHRSGRTARAGTVGEVITFVSPEEEERLGEIEQALGFTVPRRIVPGFDRSPFVPSPDDGHRGQGRGARGSHERSSARAIAAPVAPGGAGQGPNETARRRPRRRPRRPVAPRH